ncbi:GNAT family N-acetyltransferase [Chryseobacterium indoltheticum]|jgi:predicted GNAT family N-acyltransferase|uniref:GNAT family N-acetyltransferase n=1 Tax=Chryseobacterium indoltheticum TaxID=254 RepID=UPI00242FC025|nr:GNAT family N-acetyltransferase [Chryseobacterium indoltheticum]MDF2831732.1 N-acetyltransferase [Chryseobacterium indoltheticum]
MMIEITKANTHDYRVLTDITKKSKAYWGYSDEQMKKWSNLLTITEEYIQNNEVYKLIINQSIVAYYSYFEIEKDSVRLDNLFVSPENIGKGYGKLLMNDFILKIKKSEAQRIILDADPNAQKFYENFGFVKIGEIETSIKDRFLPIMELKL